MNINALLLLLITLSAVISAQELTNEVPITFVEDGDPSRDTTITPSPTTATPPPSPETSIITDGGSNADGSPAAPSSSDVCELGAIMDPTFIRVFGDEAESRLEELISYVNAVVEPQLGIQYKIAKTLWIRSAADHKRLGSLEEQVNQVDAGVGADSDSSSNNLILDQLQLAVSMGDLFQGKRFCQVHMFTALKANNAIVGTGFRPGICRPNGLNSGYSILTTENATTPDGTMDQFPRLYLATVAHELIHGLGGRHDFGKCSGSSPGERYLMNSAITISSKNILKISDCTKDSVKRHVQLLRDAGALCFNGIYPNVSALEIGILEGAADGLDKSSGESIRLSQVWLTLLFSAAMFWIC